MSTREKRPEAPALMTVEWVAETLQYLERIKHDDESAHAAEDQVRSEVLAHIANGTCDDPVACAREALKSSSIAFARWYS